MPEIMCAYIGLKGCGGKGEGATQYQIGYPTASAPVYVSKGSFG